MLLPIIQFQQINHSSPPHNVVYKRMRIIIENFEAKSKHS